MSPDDSAGSDKLDIADVLLRYSSGIDRRDWDLFRRCFTSDVYAEYDDVGVWSGVDEFTNFMSVVHAGMGHTLHRITNPVIDVTGDRATARTYVDAILMASDGRGGIGAVGFFDDDFVRTPEGWRIARRHFTMVHVRPLG